MRPNRNERQFSVADAVGRGEDVHCGIDAGLWHADERIESNSKGNWNMTVYQPKKSDLDVNNPPQGGSGVPIKKDFDQVKDSGKQQAFSTGSKRNTREGKGRFDLIPTYPLRRLARHYENGAVKYEPRNWERGQPLSRYLDSACRHWVAVLEGLTDEDHASAVSWNMFAYIATCQWIEEGKLPPELDDLGHTSKGKKQ